MQNIYITGTGFWIPEDGLTTNDEVVNSYTLMLITITQKMQKQFLMDLWKLWLPQAQSLLKKRLELKQGIYMINIIV